MQAIKEERQMQRDGTLARLTRGAAKTRKELIKR